MVAVTAPAVLLTFPVLSVYLVTDFIMARKSDGSAARREFAGGLLGVPLLPSRVFLM